MALWSIAHGAIDDNISRSCTLILPNYFQLMSEQLVLDLGHLVVVLVVSLHHIFSLYRYGLSGLLPNGFRRTKLKIFSETSNFDKMATRCYFFNILYSLCLFPSFTAWNQRETSLRICRRCRKSLVARKKWQKKFVTWQQNDVIGRIEPNDCEYIKCLSPEKP